jgi:formylglycine-generating enzyme required for sulfatase activity
MINRTTSLHSRRPARLMALALLAAPCLLPVPPCAARPGAAAPRPAAPKKLASFTQPVPSGATKLEMVAIPGGSFTMADPTRNGAKRKVTLKPFWISKTEVTWEAYAPYAYGHPLSSGMRDFPAAQDAVLTPSNPFIPPGNAGWGSTNEPAGKITYNAAVKFCLWLSKQTGKKYRLPTEAEWEYACRAGSAASGPLAKDALDKVAWYVGNAKEEDGRHKVATKAPNALGLYDMLGNVAEWCTGLGKEPVVRGGSFKDPAEKVSPEARQPYSPEWQVNDYQDPKSPWWLLDGPQVGFRVVCEGP